MEEHNSWMANNVDNTFRISFCQEPYLNTDFKITGFSKDFNLYYVGKPKCRTRACILTTKNVKAWVLNQFSDLDTITIGIKSNNKVYILCSVYMPYVLGISPASNLLRGLVEYCRVNNIGLVVGADANSHHILWNSSDNNGRGEDLADFIMGSNLHVCNSGSSPTFVIYNREEIIDVTLANTRSLDLISSWKVSEKETFSDHRRIEFTFGATLVEDNSKYRNIRKTMWLGYKETLASKVENINFSQDLDEAAMQLEEAIIYAYEKNSKEVKVTVRKDPPWWTAELSRRKKKVRICKQRYEKYRTEDNLEKYAEIRRLYKSEVRIAKSVGWQRLCTETKDLTVTARIQKVLKMGRKQELGTVRDLSGKFTTTPEQTLKVLLDTHFPSKDIAETENFEVNYGINVDVNLESIVNEQSVRTAFRSFKPFKAPGTDGIFPILIQKGMDTLIDIIIKLYIQCLTEEKTPRRWLEARVVFIPKAGKTDYGDPKSVRPLSLSSFLLKGLERLVYWHINRTTLKVNKFNKNLYSYRESMSTEDALHNTIYKIEKALEKKEIALVLFLDINSAFSNASIPGMINNMGRQGMETKIIKWTEDMLCNRKVIATLNGGMAEKDADNGTPQGGVMSGGILFNGDMNELLENQGNRFNGEVNAFADDGNDLIIGIDIATMAQQMQQDIRKMEEWGKRNGLGFSPSKTKVMLCTNKRKIPKPKIYLAGQEIEYVSSYKYLGITINNKLSWHEHVKNITKKANMTMSHCRKMLGKTWGLSPKVCRWMYISLVRPILSYGSIVWLKSTVQKSLIQRIERVQRKGCLSILNAMRSTPTAGMEIIIGIRPIQVFLQEISIKSYIRLQENGNWRPLPGELLNKLNHSNMVEKFANQVDEVYMPKDKLLNREFVQNKFGVRIESREAQNAEKIRLTPLDPEVIHCFTDGSKIGNCSGSGFILRGQEVKAQGYLSLGNYTTVFQAEVIALGECCRSLKNKGVNGKIIRIYIDSQAAIKAMDSYIITSKIVLETKLILNQISEVNNVEIRWIKSHIGHLGNEVADRLAKRGSCQQFSGVAPILPITKAAIRTGVDRWGEKRHQEIWNEMTDENNPKRKCRQTRMLVPAVINKIWKTLNNQTRKGAMIATQVLTGHASLNRHLNLMNLEDTAMCDNCGLEEETVEHFIGKCQVYSNLRYHMFGRQIIETQDFVLFSIRDLLKFTWRTKRLEFYSG